MKGFYFIIGFIYSGLEKNRSIGKDLDTSFKNLYKELKVRRKL